MTQLEHIETIEKRLWSSADNLRANSNYASNEYFLPVMGLIFLRHAYSRYLQVKPDIEASLPSRGGQTRPLTREDFSSKSAIYLKPEAQFDTLVSLRDSDDRAQAVIQAMEAIEADYDTLKGILPKSEYQELDNDVLGSLLRTFNDPALKKATGDIFGRIYEYFLTQFANQSAHDGGEFFTPVSIVQMIVNVIEPDHGTVIDPACGSGGMFVQSAHFIEKLHKNPQEVATFYGQEKNPTTIRLAKMNLAVHGLEGNIQKGITYYEDQHELCGKADFVMANPPFNVDDVDAEKIRNDPRLPFGLPSVNKKGAVSNGNYLWISYFYSYLNPTGRAGFVMSSQASSAGGQEVEVRRKLVESGDVDVMIAIRSNFFYTRSVPCELWFFNRNKPAQLKDKVLMLDARNVFRKVTRKIYDFSPEQLANLTAIIWLHRGEQQRFLARVESYLQTTLDEAQQSIPAIENFISALDGLTDKLDTIDEETRQAIDLFKTDRKSFENSITGQSNAWAKAPRDNAGLLQSAKELEPLAETSRDLLKQIDQLYKFVEKHARDSNERGLNRLLNELDDLRKQAVEQLKQVHYTFKQAHWLQERFPEAQLRDVEGLVKLVDIEEIKANDWSLTPGRYVGVAPEPENEDFDFEETLRDIHIELKGLNEEAAMLAERIQKNFEELGV
ncbi:type I restriction enzyme M protein [Nitrosomonas marina]|uniref:site-specific DNA-methyltransferase (adenine-specific) n=1 Tax=Nitrosomonas marina TaxID=917 RepID=A0A1I0FNE9_9PROT|nr:N-6 DNA methylase [Nitrosomonas marina]SET59098.1 type I restriction enzyme M protein [Nitrosomonas marina]